MQRTYISGFAPKKAALVVMLSIAICAPSSVALSKKKHSCQILVINGGTIRPNVDSTTLTSKEPGAYAGTAIVTTTRKRFKLRVETPLGFNNMPSGGADNVIFKSTFMGHGATNFSERPGGNSKRLKRGQTNVETHFLARKTTGSFTAGNYSATLTLRCE